MLINKILSSFLHVVCPLGLAAGFYDVVFYIMQYYYCVMAGVYVVRWTALIVLVKSYILSDDTDEESLYIT